MPRFPPGVGNTYRHVVIVPEDEFEFAMDGWEPRGRYVSIQRLDERVRYVEMEDDSDMAELNFRCLGEVETRNGNPRPPR